MNEVQTILLTILAISYTILTVLLVVAMYLVVKILRAIRNTAEHVEASAENITGTIDAAADKIKPLIATGVAKMVMGMFTHKKKRGGNDE